MRVLFVCTGNTCRSPMAEALFNDYAKQIGLEATAHSAGVFCLRTSPVSENSVAVMSELELDISTHMSRQVSEEILTDADLVLAMSKSHTELLNSHFPKHSDKVYDLTRFVEEFGEIEDPYGASKTKYAICRNRLAFLVEKLVVKLKKNENKDKENKNKND